MRFEIKKVSIAGYDYSAHSGLSTTDKHIIRRIIFNGRFPGPGFDFHNFEIRENFVA
jgi:hypothetical protein